MTPKICLCLLFAAAQLPAQDLLRGEARVDIDAPYLSVLGLPAPNDDDALREWAREEAALTYSAMIYGWAFVYEPGDAAREIKEHITLTALGSVDGRDPRLVVEQSGRDGPEFSLWSEYRLSESQRQRVRAWQSAGAAETQAAGYGPLTGKAAVAEPARLKEAALEDAARRAIRAKVRAAEQNRPRRVQGVIALAAFPAYGVLDGLRQTSARFRLKVDSVETHAFY